MVSKMSKYLKVITIMLLGTISLGCTSLRPYRMDIEQGNTLSEEKVGQLSVGMTEEQVLFLLGTPILQDVFHANRWDYTYYKKPGYGEPLIRHFSVYFDDDGKVSYFS